jgi:hypothetical protein
MSKRLYVQKACLTVLCFVFLLFAQQRQNGEILEDSVASSSQGVRATAANDTSAPASSSHKIFGCGLSICERIFYPVAISNFINDMKSGYWYEAGLPDMFMAFGARLKFLYNPLPFLGLEPNCRILYATSNVSLAGSDRGTEDINFLTYTAGCDLWARVAHHKRVTFKAGIGAAYGSGSLTTSGNLGSISSTGTCYGMNLLGGAEFAIKMITVNIEILCPIETIIFSSRSGQLTSNNTNPDGTPLIFRYPASDNLRGLEIHEGVTFLF